MPSMSRPCFNRCTQIALAAWMTVAASACGKGLFTARPLPVDTGDGGTGADGPFDIPLASDGPESPAVDAYPDQEVASDAPVDGAMDRTPDGEMDRAADGTADVPVPPSSATQIIDFPGSRVTLVNAAFSATLVVPRGAFAQPTIVTLTLVTPSLVSDDGGLAPPPGPIGPIFSLSKTDALGRPVTLQNPASFELVFTPADGSIPVQRVALAYLDQSNPNLWIAISGSSYNQATGVLSGSVVEFSATRLFAPVESCLSGEACPDPKTCGGGACQ
jgi:hypothetical protein